MAAKQSFRAGDSVKAFFFCPFFFGIQRSVLYLFYDTGVMRQVLLMREMISGVESISPLFLFMEKRSGWIDRHCTLRASISNSRLLISEVGIIIGSCKALYLTSECFQGYYYLRKEAAEDMMNRG
jgi:hypothetical protein